MEKLLHEKLRECHSFVGLNDILGIHTIKIGDAFETLADEIEHRYHPKPVDGDGRPWELGDACITDEGEDATIVGYRPGGRVFIDLHDGREFARCYASDLKRPPKVLDADGVEIKVGDTVYWTDETSDPGREAHVYGLGFIRDAPFSPVQVFTTKDCTLRSGWMMPKHLTHERPVLDANGERICEGDTVWHVTRGEKHTVEKVDGEDGGIFVECCNSIFGGIEFTHREPDSLEKLQDLISAIDNVHGGSNTELHLQLDKAYDMCTALIERGA